jgi:hypothetical protein
MVIGPDGVGDSTHYVGRGREEKKDNYNSDGGMLVIDIFLHRAFRWRQGYIRHGEGLVPRKLMPNRFSPGNTGSSNFPLSEFPCDAGKHGRREPCVWT